MFININNTILECIIIYLFIVIQYKSNTLLSFIPNNNNKNSNNQKTQKDKENEKLKNNKKENNKEDKENEKLKNNKNDDEVEKLKKEIIKLNNENSSLKDENKRLKNEIQRLKSELNNNSQNLEKYKLEINELKLSLTNKNNEINNLNNEMKNLQLNNNKKILVDLNELLIIQFKSIDQKVDMSYNCQKNDVFVRIEEKLYNDYPEYKDLNTYFTVNGHVVKRFRNMVENDIRNNDKILLNIYE